MTANPEPTRWLDPQFLAELLSATALALWIVATVVTNLNPYIAVVVGVVLYAALLVTLLYRKQKEDKLSLDKLVAAQFAETMKHFQETVQAPVAASLGELRIRRDTVQKVIQLIEDTMKDESLSPDARTVYQDMLRRMKDMARAYSDPTVLP